MPKDKEEVMRKIKADPGALKRYGVKQLGLFGSFARGEQKSSSDLDFLVELEKETFRAYMGLKFFLEDLFGCKVDLVMKDSVKPRLRDIILREVIYV